MPTKKQRHLTYIYLDAFFPNGYVLDVYMVAEAWSAILLYAGGIGDHQLRQQPAV